VISTLQVFEQEFPLVYPISPAFLDNYDSLQNVLKLKEWSPIFSFIDNQLFKGL